MVRPAATGLATAFYRLYLLDALAPAPARPARLLATIAAERLPLASGAYGRALQSLLEGGHLVPASEGAVALTPVRELCPTSLTSRGPGWILAPRAYGDGPGLYRGWSTATARSYLRGVRCAHGRGSRA